MENEVLNNYQILRAIQMEVGKLEKDAENPFYKSRYASLNKILDTLTPIMDKFGVMILHTTEPGKENTLQLHTRLVNIASGEVLFGMVSECPLKSNDPQAMGSAISYMRRYSIPVLLGLQMDDDDGNEAADAEYKVYASKISLLGKRAKDMNIEELDVQVKKGLEYTKKYPDLQKKLEAIHKAYIE